MAKLAISKVLQDNVPTLIILTKLLLKSSRALLKVFKMAPHITVSFNHQSDFAARKMSLRATKYLHAVPDVNIILKMYFFDKQWKWDWLSEHSVQFS
jgi:hypothetical protein